MGGTSWALLGLALLLVMLALAWTARTRMAGPAWSLWRFLFPAWRFFQRIERVPELCFRVRAVAGEPFGDWLPAFQPGSRSAAALLINAAGNLRLAERALVDELVELLQDPAAATSPTLSDLLCYRFVQRLVTCRIGAGATSGNPASYQFRIDLVGRQPWTEPSVTVLLSPEHLLAEERSS